MIAIDWLRVPVLALAQDVAIPKRKGNVADCLATLEKLYDKCASDFSQVIIPDPILGPAQAIKYGSFLGGCAPAHYLGGEGLEVFFLPQEQANKPSESGG